jgi:hypothetical protein
MNLMVGLPERALGAKQEFSSVDIIISPWFSMLIYHLGIEK